MQNRQWRREKERERERERERELLAGETKKTRGAEARKSPLVGPSRQWRTKRRSWFTGLIMGRRFSNGILAFGSRLPAQNAEPTPSKPQLRNGDPES